MTQIDWPLPDVATRLLGVVSYLFTAGPVLKDGDTLGVSEDERVRITFSQETMRLVLDYERQTDHE